MIEKLKNVLEQIDLALQDLPDKGRITAPELLKKCNIHNISDLLFNELVRFYISESSTFIMTRGRKGGIYRKPTATIISSLTNNSRDSCPAVGVQSLIDLTEES